MRPKTSRCALCIVQKIFTYRLKRLCFEKRDEILYIYIYIYIYEWGVSVDQSGILPSVFIVHHASGIRHVGNSFFLYVKYVDRWSLLFAHCV